MLAPNVVLTTTGHPVLPALCKHGLQFSMPIHIGDGCWLGAGVIVVPGVTIGDNAVVAAGSVVIHDVPANTLVAGNPARVIRRITKADRAKYKWANF